MTNFIEVEVTQPVTIDIEKEADKLEDCFMDEQICSNCGSYSFSDLDDADYERVLVAICETIIQRYKN